MLHPANIVYHERLSKHRENRIALQRGFRSGVGRIRRPVITKAPRALPTINHQLHRHIVF
jgi:hypothetical protein